MEIKPNGSLYRFNSCSPCVGPEYFKHKQMSTCLCKVDEREINVGLTKRRCHVDMGSM